MAQEVDAISFLRQRYGQGQAIPAQPGSAVDWLRSKYAATPATTEGPGVMDYAGQSASSFVKGALETGRTLLDFPSTMGSAGASLLGLNEAADTAKTLSLHYWAARGLQALERMVPTNAKVDAEKGGAAKWISETGANALGSTLPFLGVGAIAKGAGASARAVTAITALTGASVNAVSGYEDAIRSGATPEQAFGALLINGGLGTLEAATPAKILARIDAKVGGGLGKAITNAFIEGGTEAMTEAVQQLGQDAYAAMTFDERREVSQGLADAAGGGGFAGVLMSLLGSGMARGHQMEAAKTPPPTAEQPAPSQAAQEPISEGQITKDGPTLQPNDERVGKALESLTRKAGEPVTVVEDQKGYEWEADRARMAGTPLVLFRVGEGKGAGENVPTGFSRGGVTFLNADLPAPERKKAVLYHELGHRLFETDQASWEAKYNEIETLAPELLQRAGDRYEASFGEKLTPQAKREEAYSALAEELPGFIRAWEENPSQFTETKRGFVRKIIDWLSEKLGMDSSVTKELKALRDQIAETELEKTSDPKLLRDVSRVYAKGMQELSNAPAAEPIQMGSTVVEASSSQPSETPLQVSEPIASKKPRAVGPKGPEPMPSGDLYDEQGRPVVGSWSRGPQAVEAKGPTTTRGDLSVPEPAPEPELPTKPNPLTRKSKAQLEQDLERALKIERERVDLVFHDRGKLWRDRFIELRQSARREPSPAQEAAAKQVRAVEANLRPRALEVLQGGHEPGMNTEAIMGALRAKEAEAQASRLERRSTNREESRAAGEKAQEAARRVGTEERFAVAYHGSPYDFDEFRSDKIGTGEGAQAYGHGLYFTDKREIAEYYRVSTSRINTDPRVAEARAAWMKAQDKISRARNKEDFDAAVAEAGRLGQQYHDIRTKYPPRVYQVDLAPAEDEYLLWDKPLSEQSEKVKAALSGMGFGDAWWAKSYPHQEARDPSGRFVYRRLSTKFLGEENTSARLRSAGIRGIKYLAGDGSRDSGAGTYNYVIFDPADIKITGKFAVAPKGNFATPDETHADTFLRKIQDRYRRLSVIQGAISRKQAISEAANAEQKVRLFPSRLRTRFEKVENRQKKVVEILSKNKISVEDAGEFVYALGAEQRNATMAKRNPRKFGTAANPGSGMTDAEAQRIQAKAYAKNKAAYEAIRDEVASMNKAKLDMAEEAGFLNAEGRKAWEEAFGPYHAPLYTWEKESDDAFSGFNTRNFNNAERLSKKAKGRMSLADNPLVSLIDSMAKWSVRSETNRVGQTLGNLIEESPDPTLWEPIDSMAKAKPEDQVFSYWQGGEKKLVILHDAKLARAMKSIGVEPAGELLRMAQDVRTTYSKLHTSWNPEFILPNLVKDAGAAAVTLNLEHGPAFAAKALNPNRLRESFFAILNDTNGKPSKLSKEIAEWKDSGGMTGWNLQPETLHKRMKDINKQVSLAANDTTGKKLVNAFLSGKKLMESLSESAENAVRFSVYRTFLEAGASPDEAARQSKTITIDFDARGEISTPFNILYLFFNANVQGTARIFQAAKKAPTHRLLTTGAALATFGYFVSYINRLLADDDENGVNRWDTVSQNDKAHNLSLMFGKERAILPLPWGWSLFTYIGQQAEALQNGRYKPGQAVGDFTAQSFDSFSPVQGSTPTQFLAPWFADPFIQVFENEDFAGRSIMPREDPFKRYKTPDAYRYFPDVDPSLRKAADALNRWTGGDQVNPGAIDVSPEAMEHLAGEVAGGAGRTVGRVAKMLDKIGHGESLKPSEAPVLRRFMQEAPQWFTYKLFSDNLTEVERHEELRKNRMPFDAAVVGQGRSTRNQIEEINRAIKRLPDGPVKKRMEDRKLEVEQRFNRFMESRQR